MIWFLCQVENIPGSDECRTVVAIKTLKSTATEKDKRDLLNELSVMKMMDPHPNVVRLLGKFIKIQFPKMNIVPLEKNYYENSNILTGLADFKSAACP